MLMITGAAVGIIMCNVWVFGTKHWDIGKILEYESRMGQTRQLGLRMMTQEGGGADKDVRVD